MMTKLLSPSTSLGWKTIGSLAWARDCMVKWVVARDPEESCRHGGIDTDKLRLATTQRIIRKFISTNQTQQC